MSRFATLAAAACILGASARSTVKVNAPKEALVLATFDGAKATTLPFQTENDPVMGGQSVSKFSVADGAGVWQGQVKIVPFLKAPGFCTVRADTELPASIADYSAGGLVFNVRTVASDTNLTAFQAQFESSVRRSEKGGGFQADFTLTASDEMQSHFVPFSKFVESWRGEKVGGAPSTAQLAKLTQIGIGADGTAGIFDVEMHSISVAMAAPAPGPSPPGPAPGPPAGGTELVDLSKKGAYRLFVVNDPVMGGKSTSVFGQHHGRAIFNGTVRIVPQLKAPGFCNAEIEASGFGKNFPDATAQFSSTGGLIYRASSTGAMSSFKAAFGTSGEFNFGSYKADFDIPQDGEMHNVFVPWNQFSNKWSPSTGEPTVKCSADPKVCPTKDSLGKIGSVGIWAEGKAGDFHVEIESVTAVATAP